MTTRTATDWCTKPWHSKLYTHLYLTYTTTESENSICDDPEDSSPSLQKPNNWHYHEAVHSYYQPIPGKIHFNIFTPCVTWIPGRDFPTKIFYLFVVSPFVLHVPHSFSHDCWEGQEAVVTYFKLLYQNLPEQSLEKPVRIMGLRAENRTWEPRNTK